MQQGGEQMEVSFWLAAQDIFLLYFVGWLGWQVLDYFGVPAASFLGGAVGACFAQLAGLSFNAIPSFFRFCLQVILGIFIGLRFNRDTIGHLKQLFWPALLVSAWMLATCFVVGMFFYRLTAVTPATAIIGAAPGGVAEMSLLALSFDADDKVVSILQFMRLVGILIVIPFLATRQTNVLPSDRRRLVSKPFCWEKSMSLTILVGLLGGLIAWYLDWPAPGLLGAISAVGLTSFLFYRLKQLPKVIRVWASLGIGCLVGLNLDLNTIKQLRNMTFPALISTLVVLMSGLILSAVLRHVTQWDILTCLLCSAPGGTTQFFILACELGADPVKVSSLQLTRLLVILGVLPVLLRAAYW